ncbi:VirB4 family type IV secretion system protein [Catelliglobosispora koreensis]|uniref:VirB4 family type IV secretion system protein n=1 Tax=Catelliglobosispora koreensis TaxID=129052 RepID=UPI0003679C17|nr:DUF87 domain-containing protein [Catelliglobosispora koreensis]
MKPAPRLKTVAPPPLSAITGPPHLALTADHAQAGSGYSSTLIVTGYPETVGPAWLEPLLAWPGHMTVSVHVAPLPPADAAARLRTQRARLEASRRLADDHGRLGDPTVDAAAGDAADLADRIARGASRLFTVAVYLTIHARTQPQLTEAVTAVQTLAASMMLDTQPATWRQLHGWTSTLPLGADSLAAARIMDTDAIAAAFPFASPDLPGPLPGKPSLTGGILYGLNNTSTGLVWWDRWQQHNYNSIVLARSGAGKSYLIKLDILRSLIDGVHVAVIDPEDEYTALAEATGGTVIRLGHPGARLNPLDIPAGDIRSDALTRRALFVHTLITVLLGQTPPPAQRSALDKAVLAAYQLAGIYNDPATWNNPAPLLRDVCDALETQATPAATDLAARLHPWTDGSYSGLFNGPTTTVPAGQLIVWSARHLPDEMRPAGMLLALDAIWRTTDTPATTAQSARRLVVVDEAWTLLRDGEGARFLYRMSKAARKRHTGLTIITQDVADILGTELGQAVANNAATQILMRQSPQAIAAVASAFGLTRGEQQLLLAAERGQGLLIGGSHRAAFNAVASRGEHRLCTTGLEFNETYGDS